MSNYIKGLYLAFTGQIDVEALDKSAFDYVEIDVDTRSDEEFLTSVTEEYAETIELLAS